MMLYKSEYGLQRVSQKAEGPKLDITSKRNLFLFKLVAIPETELFGRLVRDRAATTYDVQIFNKVTEWSRKYTVKSNETLEMMVRIVVQESSLSSVKKISLRDYELSTDFISERELSAFNAQIGETTYSKLFKALECELVSLVDRGSRASGNTLQYFGGVREEAGVFSIRVGFAKSQELDKIEEKRGLLESALVSNLGVVSTKTENGEPSFFIRSGKPNTKKKFLETIRMMALNEVDNLVSEEKIAEILKEERMFVKMPVLNSFMDNSSVKYHSEMARGMKAEHTEQVSLQRMREVARGLSPKDLCFSVQLGGRNISVIIPSPIVLEFPFSFGNRDSIEQARRNNMASNSILYELLGKKWSRSENPSLKAIANIFAEKKTDYEASFSFIDENYRQMKLSETELMCLDALKIGLTTSRSALNGLNLEGRSRVIGDPESTLEFMYSSVLQEELGILAISCKSGVDRTGTGAAILIAMKNHKEITGDMFRPDNGYLPWTDPLFKFLFTKAADEFCQDAHRVTREDGKSLKAKDQAFFHKTYVVNVADREALQTKVNALGCVQKYTKKLGALEIKIDAASPIILGGAPALSDEDEFPFNGERGRSTLRGESTDRPESGFSSMARAFSMARGVSVERDPNADQKKSSSSSSASKEAMSQFAVSGSEPRKSRWGNSNDYDCGDHFNGGKELESKVVAPKQRSSSLFGWSWGRSAPVGQPNYGSGAAALPASANDDDSVRMLGIWGDPVTSRGQSSARLSGERDARWSSFSIFSSVGRGSSAGRSSGGSSTERGSSQPVAPKKTSPYLFDWLLDRSATGEQPASGSMEHSASEDPPRGQSEERTSSLRMGGPSKAALSLVRERRSSVQSQPTIPESDEFSETERRVNG